MATSVEQIEDSSYEIEPFTRILAWESGSIEGFEVQLIENLGLSTPLNRVIAHGFTFLFIGGEPPAPTGGETRRGEGGSGRERG